MAIQRLKKLEDANRVLKEALEMYADIATWSIGDSYKQHSVIIDADLEYFPKNNTSDLIAGLSARAALKKAAEIMSEEELIHIQAIKSLDI